MNSINNVERFRQRMRDGKICVGTGVTVTDPLVSEVMAQAGSDFIWIETEHSHLDLPAVMGHIMAVRGTQAAPLVRVPWNDPVLIKPILDMAPAGIIVPMIRSADEARQAVEACRYPPKGIRGFGPTRNMYGMDSMEEYLKVADEQIMVFVQIEHIDAVNDLDAILATPGLDGIVLGRNDLSGSLGKLGQHDDPELLEIIDTVFAKTRQAGLFIGVSIGYNPDTVRQWRAKGVHFFDLVGDMGHLFEGVRTVAEAVHGLDTEQ
jgi:2-keto-3-deoxy-L-rhamnonate aldolase RhmA